ncbi:MAG: methionine--tRNA ligase [bacterium]|nr:methionine--tRNA ligase [bacterium]
MSVKEAISWANFAKLDLRVGKVVEAGFVEGSTKLLKLTVDIGEARDPDESETRRQLRTIVAGLGGYYDPESLVGKEIVVVVNLEPKALMGVESQGMLLAADVGGRPVLVTLDEVVPEGSVVR